MTAITELAEFVTSLSFEDIPETVVDRSKTLLRDQFGVAVAGCTREAGEVIRSHVDGGGTGATVFDSRYASALEAALVNGTLGGVLSYDDTFESMVIHPSSPVLPASIAATELASETGRALLTGYIVGIETAYRIGKFTHPEHYAHGWHSTGTIGSFGAAAGAASILGLTDEQLCRAFGIAASSSSSLRKNGGTMMLSLHGGHAAQVGLRAARLAGNGFTANANVFEGELSYSSVTAPEGEDNLSELRPVQDEWGVSDVGLKAYPCARVPQSAMDGLKEVLAREAISVEDVMEVKAFFDPSLEGVLEYPAPEDWTEARGSIEFCLATILREGDVAVNHFTDEYLQDPSLSDDLEKITPRYDIELGDSFSKYGSRVRVITADGEERTAEVNHPPGSPRNPLSERRQREKFEDCTEPVLGPDGTEEVLSAIERLERDDGFEAFIGAIHDHG